jgi:hypothetical protein
VLGTVCDISLLGEDFHGFTAALPIPLAIIPGIPANHVQTIIIKEDSLFSYLE